MSQQTISTPFGHVAIIENIDGIKVILSPVTVIENINHQSGSELSKEITKAIQAYLNNPAQQSASAFDIDLLSGSPYQKRVWRAIASIPTGTTATYTQVAEQLQSCPRAVANACGANRVPILIPCHRVVAKNGIGGFMRSHPNGLIIKRWLLNHEDVHV